MVMLLPALACAALAVATTVLPGRAGAARLAGLGRRRGSAGAPRSLPAAVAISAGALAGLLALGPVGAAAGVALATAWHRRRARGRAQREAASVTSELADALGRITEELRAGVHPAAALTGTGADGPHARAVLAPVAAAAALGDDVPSALAAEADRHPAVARDLRRVAQTWALADRHGVAPAALLSDVLTGIRWRTAHAGRIRAQLAGPRATAAVLVGLPAVGLALGELIGAAPLAVLRSSATGQLLVAVGLGLVAAGAAWTARILRTAVPR